MINEQLLEYIKQQLSQGVSVNLIRNNLITQGGWAPIVVDEALVALGQSPVSLDGMSVPQSPISLSQTMQTITNQASKPKLPRFYIIPFLFASIAVGLFSALCFTGGYLITALFGSVPPQLSFITTYGPMLGAVLAILFIIFLVGSIGLAFYKNWARKIILAFSVLILIGLYSGVYEGYVTQNLFSLILFGAMFVHLLCGPKTVAGFKNIEVKPLNGKLCYSLVGVLIILFATFAFIHKTPLITTDRQIGLQTVTPVSLASSSSNTEDFATLLGTSAISESQNSPANSSNVLKSSTSTKMTSPYPPFLAQVKGGNLSVSDRNQIIDANLKLVDILKRADVAEFRKYAVLLMPPSATASDIAKFNSAPDSEVSSLIKLVAPLFIKAITPAALSAVSTTWTVVSPTHVTIVIESKDGNMTGQAVKINGVWY